MTGPSLSVLRAHVDRRRASLAQAGWWQSPLVRQVADLAGYAILLIAVSLVAMSLSPLPQGPVLIWPATPIAVAKMTRAPVSRWPLMLGVTAVSLFLFSMLNGVPASLAICYVLIDVIVMLLVAGGLRRIDPDPRTLRGYAGVIFISILGAGSSTLLAAPVNAQLTSNSTLHSSANWFASIAMGLIVLLPALKATRRAVSEELRLFSPVLLLPVAVSTLIALVVFGTGTNPSLFFLLPCTVFAALLYRFIGAAASTLTIAAIATIYTMNGSGPIADAFPLVSDRVLFLQIFIGIVTLTAFPVAALLYEQSRALGEISDKERELRLLTDHSSDLIVRLGLDGVRRYASPASERVLGYRPEELIGSSPCGQVHPEDRDRVERRMMTLVPGGDSTVFHYRMLNKRGDYVWLEGAFRLVGDSHGDAEVVGSIRDIGQRREAESRAVDAASQVEERQRLLEMAESAARLGHWRLNMVDRRVMWSPEIFRIHGVPPHEEPDLDGAIDFYHPDDRGMVRDAINHAIATGGSFAFDARLIQRDGTMRWVASRGQAERAMGAGVVGVFGVMQDTTDQVKAMAELREAREAAERALAAKATFTATISHEIRTPLTSILAAVQLLRDTPDRAERMRHLDALEHAGRTLSDIVDDVLTFSKLEGGHGNPETIVFEPRALLTTVTGMFAGAAQRHEVSLAFDAPAGEVVGDPARVQRVLTNLIGNAVKFTRGGSVQITATRDSDDRWRFEVADTGVGIRDDRLDAIFEPFVQADDSTTRSYGGTGLGLSISRMLVESMGGSIGVRSRPGDGSRFWFELPLPAAGDRGVAVLSTTADDDGPATDTARPRATVLVAEDNDTNRYLITELVRRLGHRVVAVENGARAVEYITAAAGNPADIVLMDVQMPVMDGIAAARAIRAWNGSGAGVPIYALTADQSDERRVTVAEAGMNGMLTKPVDLPQLRSLLNEVAPAIDADVEVTGAHATIDPARIRALTDALGEAQRDTLLRLLIDDASRIPARLRTLIDHGRLGLARREAHSLRGAAASIGAAGLVAALRVVEDAADDAVLDAAVLDEIDRCAQAVINSANAAMLETA